MPTYLFPGQGSQAIGMGQNLFEEFADLCAIADDILGYSLKELCLEDPEGKLNQTNFTQPALYTVNALMYLKKIQENTTKPNFVAGHSLGEYNALFAAGVFDFATGLKLVKKRGELMNESQAGGMAAVIGLTPAEVIKVIENNHLHQVSIANDNSHTQIVITGEKSQIESAQALFEQAGARMFVPLKVSGAFHSPLMQAAQEAFQDYLKNFDYATPQIPVIANSTAQPYEADKIAQTLAEQITHTVRWTETIQYLLNQGETELEEVGPGKVLSGLVRRIKNGQ